MALVVIARDLQLTLVLAIQSVKSVWTGRGTLITNPAGRTVTLPCHLVAGRVVLAVALFLTLGAVETDRTLRLA